MGSSNRQTDPTGRFSLRVPEGDWILTAHVPGFSSSPEVRVAVKEGELREGIAIVLVPGATIQGKVILECTMSKTGEVVDAQVSQGVEELNQAAIEAVRQWRYEPMVGPDKKPVGAKFTVTVNFRLQ